MPYTYVAMMATMLMIYLWALMGHIAADSAASSSNLNCSQLVDSPDGDSEGSSGQNVIPQGKNCSHIKRDQTRVHAALPSFSQHNISDAENGLSFSLSNTSLEKEVRYKNELDQILWQCLMRRARASRLEGKTSKKKATKTVRFCSSDVMKGNKSDIKKGEGLRNTRVANLTAEEWAQERDCLPLLFFLFPTLCNETRLCLNLTGASLDSIPERYWPWNKKKKGKDDGSEAVVYIVVVLAFYSFGIVFMMANFIRQEQRELEEAKLYKQYVKVARDRWLTSRGNMANKLALQALNTFNAVPQTTDDSKITFV